MMREADVANSGTIDLKAYIVDVPGPGESRLGSVVNPRTVMAGIVQSSAPSSVRLAQG